MKKYIVTLLALLSLTVMPVNALTIHLGDTVGQPADLGSETARLEGLISGYNVGNPTLLSLTGLTAFKTAVENGGPEVTLNLSGFDGYLMLKWGDKDCFYRINDTDPTTPFSVSTAQYLGNGEYTFYSDSYSSRYGAGFDGCPPALGLSHYTTWGDAPSVPDPMSTSAMLAPSLFVVGYIRRKTK